MHLTKNVQIVIFLIKISVKLSKTWAWVICYPFNRIINSSKYHPKKKKNQKLSSYVPHALARVSKLPNIGVYHQWYFTDYGIKVTWLMFSQPILFSYWYLTFDQTLLFINISPLFSLVFFKACMQIHTCYSSILGIDVVKHDLLYILSFHNQQQTSHI